MKMKKVSVLLKVIIYAVHGMYTKYFSDINFVFP